MKPWKALKSLGLSLNKVIRISSLVSNGKIQYEAL